MTKVSGRERGTGSRSFSSLFSWSSPREMTARSSSFLDLDGTTASGKGGSVGGVVATELTHFDDDEHLSYTSLRDLLPSSRPGSPVKRPPALQSGESEERSDDGEGMWERLPIKNRLVEQAARAYLLPVSSQSVITAPEQFLARYWARLTTPSRLTSSENLLAPSPGSHSCVNGCTHGCLSCLPAVLWLDLTRVVHALFSQLRTPSLLSHHAHHAHSKAILRSSHTIMSPSLVTPSLVK